MCSSPSAVTCRAFQKPPDIVNQHIEAGQTPEYLVGQPPYLRLGGQIRDEHVHLSARKLSGSRGPPPRFTRRISTGNRDTRTHGGQTQGGRPARCHWLLPVTSTVLPAIGRRA